MTELTTAERLDRLEEIAFDTVIDLGPLTFNSKLSRQEASCSLIADVRERRNRRLKEQDADRLEEGAARHRSELARTK